MHIQKKNYKNLGGFSKNEKNNSMFSWTEKI